MFIKQCSSGIKRAIIKKGASFHGWAGGSLNYNITRISFIEVYQIWHRCKGANSERSLVVHNCTYRFDL